MAQLHYGDMEARRQLSDVDQGEDVYLQGEGYGVFSDDQKRSPNLPPPRSSEAPLQAHHQRNDAISGTDLSSPLTEPSNYGTLPVTTGYGNLDLKPEEARRALPAGDVNDEGRGFDRSGIAKEESMAKELQDQSATGGGIIDVHTLKDNYVDLSEGNINEQSVGPTDEGPKHEEEESMAKEPQDQSAMGGGVIDVHSLKDHYVDLSEGKINEQSRGANSPTDEGAKHEETAQFTSQIESPFDDPKQEQSAQIHAPIADPAEQEPADDNKQEGSKPCNEVHGCHSFEGDDGREKIVVEGFNIYSGEPENVFYDAEDVMSGQPESEVDVKDDGMQDTQEGLGDIKQEEKTPPQEDVDQLVSRETALESSVVDPSYVMGGQPESGVVVKEDASGQDMQDVLGKPPLREADVRDLQEYKPENEVYAAAGVMGGQPGAVVGIVDDVRDVQSGLGDMNQEQKPLDVLDVRELQTEQQPLPIDEGVQEYKPENEVYAAAGVMGGQPGAVVDIVDDVRDVRELQSGLGDIKQEQKPLSSDGVDVLDVRELQTEQQPLSIDEGVDARESQVDVRELQTEEKPLPNDEGVDACELQNEQKPLPNDEGVDALPNDEGVDARELQNEQKPLPNDGVNERELLSEQKPHPNDEGVVVVDGDVHDFESVLIDDELTQKPLSSHGVDVRELQSEQQPLPNDEGVQVQEGVQTEEQPIPNDGVNEGELQPEQKSLPNDDGVDVRELQPFTDEGDVDMRMPTEQQPFPNDEAVDVRELQPEQKSLPKDGVDLRELQPFTDEGDVGDVRELQPFTDEGDVDVRDLQPLPNDGVDVGFPKDGVDVRELQPFTDEGDVGDVDVRELQPPSNDGLDVGEFQTEQKPLPNDEAVVVGELQTEQKPLPNDEGVDVREFRTDQEPLPNDAGVEVREFQIEQKPLPNDEDVDVRELQTDQKPLPNDEGVNVRDLQTEEKLLPSYEGLDMRKLQIGEEADTALDCEDKASIADVKSDDQTGMRSVRNPDQPLADEIVNVQGALLPNDMDVQEVQTEEGAEIDVGREDKASITDVKSDDQSGMRSLRNSDQPLADGNVNVQGALLTNDMPEVPKQAISGEERKEAEQGQAKSGFLTALDNEQKDMAQTGEQFILNAPVVDYNTWNVPVAQEAELKMSSQGGDASLKGVESASAASPYTEFGRTDDYVKVGYGAEGFVPKNNEEVDRELSEPVDQEKERRQTDEHPLDKTLQLDESGVSDGKLPSGGLYGVIEGKIDASRPVIDESEHNKSGEYGEKNVPAQANVDQYERPPTRPHPQPEDLLGYLNGSNNNDNNNNNAKDATHPDDGQHPEGAPHKKGVFERLKERLTPHHDESK